MVKRAVLHEDHLHCMGSHSNRLLTDSEISLSRQFSCVLPRWKVVLIPILIMQWPLGPQKEVHHDTIFGHTPFQPMLDRNRDME